MSRPDIDEPNIDPNIPPLYTTVAVMLRSFKGVQAASSVLQDGNMIPSPIPMMIRKTMRALAPPKFTYLVASIQIILVHFTCFRASRTISYSDGCE